MKDSNNENSSKTILMLKEKLNAKIQSNKQKSCMIYPNNEVKSYWDGFVTIILLFSCITTPYRIAFSENEPPAWVFINISVDSIFAIDIILSFMSAYSTDEYELIDDRC